MNTSIERLCDNANLEGMKRIPAIQLPIKEMILYLETKINNYDHILGFHLDTNMTHLKQKSMECIAYLKKIQ